LLDVGFIHFGEKVLDTVLVLQVVQHDESLSRGGDKCRDKPFVEFVDYLQVPVAVLQTFC